MDLTAIQKALRERNIDAWLFYDHHHRDPIAYRVLGLPNGLMVTRRWFYLIPAKGEPTKLVHKIEAGHLDTLPGTKRLYSGWQELFDSMKGLLASHRDIAMQYSPNNLVFTISLVDAGTVDLIRKLWQRGNSTRQIAAKARISQSTASRYVRRFEERKQAAAPPDREAAPPIGGPVVILTCIRCWRRYLAPAQRVADLFCPQCTK